ncbi:hypothetical protein XELAEV_18039247mg [Xenopus laevis]|uniref:C2H2-type domain-containing protein n=1 Tax=Xenopus laevis TaxID=8355 RepID=A0A974C771_XENLA|nr:hypothetical protein XELAEV_18039247mg [Xenopus laevis]
MERELVTNAVLKYALEIIHLLTAEYSITVCQIKDEQFDNVCTEEPMVTENIHKENSSATNHDLQDTRKLTQARDLFCNVCGKTFARKSHVSVHQGIHTEEKPYTCMECVRKFTNNSHLVLNKVVHTREKPFTCPKCGIDFTQNSSLVKHSEIHADQKPHVCNECGKSYCHNANLDVNLRLHAGEKPYVCRHCERGFAKLVC